MEHRTFLDALDAQKDAQDFLLATVLEGQQPGDRIAALRWTSGMDVRTGNASDPKSFCIEKMHDFRRVYAGRYARFCRAFWCRGTVGHLRRRTCSSGGRPGWQSCWICPLPGWKIVRNMQMHCGKQGRIECSVRHLKRLWRRYRVVQRHTFVY